MEERNRTEDFKHPDPIDLSEQESDGASKNILDLKQDSQEKSSDSRRHEGFHEAMPAYAPPMVDVFGREVAGEESAGISADQPFSLARAIVLGLILAVLLFLMAQLAVFIKNQFPINPTETSSTPSGQLQSIDTTGVSTVGTGVPAVAPASGTPTQSIQGTVGTAPVGGQ